MHLAMVAMGGEQGMDIDLKNIPAVSGLTDTRLLYSESAGRFIVTVDPAKKEKFESVFRGLTIGLAGRVTGTSNFRISGLNSTEIMCEDIFSLKNSFFKTFGGLI